MSNQTAEEKTDLSAKEWMIDQYPENAEFYKNGGASSIFEDMENYAEPHLRKRESEAIAYKIRKRKVNRCINT